MKIGSLFSGIGGLELGLERATGGEVVWQVEANEFCRSVLERHWPSARRFNDVREVGAGCLESVDLICGGFPCQDVSTAGRRVGVEGSRSGLWTEFVRIVRELQPKFVVVENVRGLLNAPGGGIGAVLGPLAQLGFDAWWGFVSAKDLGAPHRRDRVFVVAWKAVANGHCGRRDQQTGSRDQAWDGASIRGPGLRRHWPTESDVGRTAHGVPEWVDRWPARPGDPQRPWEATRTAYGGAHKGQRMKALGNAVVPACGYAIGRVVEAIQRGTSNDRL